MKWNGMGRDVILNLISFNPIFLNFTKLLHVLGNARASCPASSKETRASRRGK